MLRQEKEVFVEHLRRDVERSAGVLLVDYTGLKVQEVEVLRRKFRAANVVYKVVKNTLMRRALDTNTYNNLETSLKGAPTGVIIGFDDPVTMAKLAFDFAKEYEKFRVKGGIVEGKAIGPKEAEALSKLPSKTEIQASVVAQIMAPGRNLVSQIKSPAARVLGAILKLVENKEKSGE